MDSDIEDIEHEFYEIEKDEKVDQERVLLMIGGWIEKLKERKNQIDKYFDEI